MGQHCFAFPVGWQVDYTPVGTNVVVLLRKFWGIAFELIPPRIAVVDVLKVTVSVMFPNTGNLDGCPALVVEVRLEEVCRAVEGILDPEKIPGTVQTQIIA